jgi:hypothetical protein
MWEKAKLATNSFILGFGIAFSWMAYGSYKDHLTFKERQIELMDSIRVIQYQYNVRASEQNALMLELIMDCKEGTCN